MRDKIKQRERGVRSEIVRERERDKVIKAFDDEILIGHGGRYQISNDNNYNNNNNNNNNTNKNKTS